MIKAIVTGAGGRMGGRIISLLADAAGISLGGAVEKKGHPLVGREIGESGAGVIVQDDLAAVIGQGDVVIDFTAHEVSARHLEIAAAKKKAIVIGSTGFTSQEIQRARELAEQVRCVLAPNMSVGVNVLFRVLADVAEIL
ncbi:MAG: 4-hydroxy-tetrahydrodipicolinate reductase, partial [Syntrophaceae bacterium]|nr:4-hydroxy-tetrahydrodipicolinate reductase [Syntrophaceae bacterium]